MTVSSMTTTTTTIVASLASVTILVAIYVYWKHDSTKSKSTNKTRKATANNNTTTTTNQTNDDALVGEKEEEEEKVKSLAKSQEIGSEATKAFKQGNFQVAVDLYQEAIEITPDENSVEKMILYNNRAAGLDKLGRVDECIADCTKALVIDPFYIKALQRRSRHYVAKKLTREALEDLSLMCAHNVVNGLEMNEAVTATMDFLMREIALEDAASIRNAREMLRASQDPVSFLPRSSFITSYMYSFSDEALYIRCPPSNREELLALAALEDRKNQQPDSSIVSLWYSIACHMKYRKDYAGSFGYLHKIRELLTKSNPNFKKNIDKSVLSKIWNDYATFLHLSGDLIRARSIFLESLELQPKSINTLLKLAGIAIELHEKEKGHEYLKSAEDIVLKEPDNCPKQDQADFFFHRGFLAVLDEQLDKAIEDVKKAISFNPNFAAAYMQLGVINFRLGKAEDGIEQLKRAQLHAPELPDVYNYLGEILLSLDRVDEAIDQFQQAIMVDPTNPIPFVNQGLVALGNFAIHQAEMQPEEREKAHAEAMQVFDRALEVDPACDIVFVHKGNDAFQRGDLEVAAGYFEKAVQCAKTMPDLEEYCALRASCTAQLSAAKKLRTRQQTQDSTSLSS